MGLAERFKKTLNTTDIFTSPEKEVPKVQNKVTTPVSTGVIPTIAQENKYKDDRLNDLVANTLKKIQSTPYWADYSDVEQEKMVSKYFDIKIKAEKYSGMKFGLKEKCHFIQDVLAMVKKL